MTPPVPQSSATLGSLVDDYRANKFLPFFIAIPVVLALWLALVGTIGNFELDGIQRIIALVVAVAIGIRLYRGIGAHVQLFEHGFVITLGFKTTSARWDEVVDVENNVRTHYRYMGPLNLIPVPSGETPICTIMLTNGKQIKLEDGYFNDITEIGFMIQKLWRQTVPAKTRLP